MAAKRPPRLTARAGEYYVAAELNRRGFDTVTFTGNMPDMDVVAITPDKQARYIQVKAQSGYGWLVNINERLKAARPDMFWVLAYVPTNEDAPRFWLIPDAEMRAIIQRQYKERPHEFQEGNAKNMCRIKTREIEGRPTGWDLLT